MKNLFKLSMIAIVMSLFMLSEALSLDPPSQQAKYIGFSQIQTTTANVLIGSIGNGEGRIVVVRANNTWTETDAAIAARATAYTDEAGVYTAVDGDRVISTSTDGGSSYVVDVLSGSLNTSSLSMLTLNTTYYVKVYEYQTDNDGAYDYLTDGSTLNPRSFKTTIILPPTDLLNNDPDATFCDVSWTHSVGADGYYLDVRFDGGAILTNYDLLDIGLENSYTITGLSVGTDYQWRLRSYDNSSFSAATDWQSFTTDADAAAPTLLSMTAWVDGTNLATRTVPAVNEADSDGSKKFILKLKFSEDMDTQFEPGMQFTGGTALFNATFSWNNGYWASSVENSGINDVYVAVYNILADNNVQSAGYDIHLVAPMPRDLAGNQFVSAGVGLDAPNLFDVDQVGPAVSTITATAVDGGQDGTKIIGGTVDFDVDFGENVTVTGTPTIALSTGTASYNSGSGSDPLIFRYTVAESDVSADLTINGTDPADAVMVLPEGATITDAAGNELTELSLNRTNVEFAGANAIVVDGVRPYVVSITRNGADQETTDASVTWRVIFSENIDAGTLAYADFTLTTTDGALTGGPAVIGAPAEQTASTVYDVTVTVLAGDAEIRLDFTGNVDDIAGNASTATHNGDETYIIDNTPPTAAITTPVADSYVQAITTISGTSEDTGTPNSGVADVEVAIWIDGDGNGIFNGGSNDFYWNGTDAFVDVVATWNQATTNDSWATWTYDIADITATNAVYYIQTRTRDVATNETVSAAAGHKVTTDNTAPTMVGDLDVDQTSYRETDVVTITFNITEAGNFDTNPTVTIYDADDNSLGTATRSDGGASSGSPIAMTYEYLVDETTDYAGCYVVVSGTDEAGNTIGGVTTLDPAFDIDNTDPSITSIGTVGLATNGAGYYVDVTFNEGIYGNATHGAAVHSGNFSLSFTQGDGTATAVTEVSYKKVDGTDQVAAAALVGGETVIRVFFNVTGTPNGIEEMSVVVANTSVYDYAGNSAVDVESDAVNLPDRVAPTVQEIKVDNIATGAVWKNDASTATITFQVVELKSITANPVVAITESNNTPIGNATFVSRVPNQNTGTQSTPLVYTYTYDVPAGDFEAVKVVVLATDVALNASVPEVLSPAFDIDNLVPTVAITAPATNLLEINTTDLEASGIVGTGSDLNGLTDVSIGLFDGTNYYDFTVSDWTGVAYDYDGASTVNSYVNWTYDVTGFFASNGDDDDTYTISANGTDLAGNDEAIIRTFVLDNVAPVITNISDNGAEFKKSGDVVSITFTVAEANTITNNPTVNVYQSNGTDLISAAVYSSINVDDYTYNYTVLAGNFENVVIKVDVADDAGNDATQGELTSAFTIDNTSPSVSTIERKDPTAQYVKASDSPVTFLVTFDEPVASVNAAAFTFSQVSGDVTGTVGAPVVVGTSPSSTWDVPVTITGGAGEFRLNQTAAGTTVDRALNALTGTKTNGETYIYDATAPTVTSIVRTGAVDTYLNATETSASFTVTFGEPVSGVAANNFTLTTTAGNSVTGTIGTPSGTAPTDTWTVVVTDLANTNGDATIRLDLNQNLSGITDQSLNEMVAAYTAGEEYIRDVTLPVVTITEWTYPYTNGTQTVTFGVSDTYASGTTQGALTGGTVVGNNVVSEITLISAYNGYNNTEETTTITISHTDLAGNTGTDTYLVTKDFTAPDISTIVRTAAASQYTNAATASYTVTFDEEIVGLADANFSINDATASITDEAVNTTTGPEPTATWTVVISTGTGDGTLRLDLANKTNLTDRAGNALVSTTKSNGETYIVDKTNPLVTITTPLFDGQSMQVLGQLAGAYSDANGVTESNIKVSVFRDDNENGTFDGTDQYWTGTTFTSGTEVKVTTNRSFGTNLSGNWTININLSGYDAETQFVAKVYAVDVATNENTATRRFVVDPRSPQVASLTKSDYNTLVVTFDENVDENTANTEANYSVSGTINNIAYGPVTPTTATRGGVGFEDEVTMDFAADEFIDILQCETLTVTVTNVEDIAGNVVDPAHNSATYTEPDETAPYVVSVERTTPSGLSDPWLTNVAQVEFTVTFSEAVGHGMAPGAPQGGEPEPDITLSALTIADFSIVGPGTGSIESVSGVALSKTVYLVTANVDATNDGATLSVGVSIGNSIMDYGCSATLGNLNFDQTGHALTPESYTVDRKAPVIAAGFLTAPLTGVYWNETAQNITWEANNLSDGHSTDDANISLTFQYSILGDFTDAAAIGTDNGAGSPLAWTPSLVDNTSVNTAKVRVTATDEAGNTSTAYEGTAFVLDNTPPVATITITPNNTPDNGYSANAATTSWNIYATFNEEMPCSGATIAFNAELDGILSAPQVEACSTNVYTNDTYRWTVTVTDANLSKLDNSITVTAATDLAGNVMTQAQKTDVKVDQVTPTLLGVAITSDNEVTPGLGNAGFAKVGDNVTVNFTASELIQTPTVTIAAQDATESEHAANPGWKGVFEMTEAQATGNVPFTVDFTDLAGNAGNQRTTVGSLYGTGSSITFDKTAPTIVIDTPTDVDCVNGTEALTWTLTEINAGTTTAAFTGGSLTSVVENDLLSTISGWGSDGSTNLSVSHTDLAGNTGTHEITVTKDTQAPTLSISRNAITLGDATAYYTTDNTVSFTLNFDEPVSDFTLDDITIYITGTVAHGAPELSAQHETTHDFTLTFNNVTGDGDLRITVDKEAFSDCGGNTIAEDVTSDDFTIDNIAPTITLITFECNNSTAAMTFSEGLYRFTTASGNLSATAFQYTFTDGDNQAYIDQLSISHTAGNANATMALQFVNTEYINGDEAFGMKQGGVQVPYDRAGNAMNQEVFTNGDVKVTPVDPTGDLTQEFCEGATVADLVAGNLGTNTIRWFAADLSTGEFLLTNVELTDATTYYGFAWNESCYSENSVAVAVTVNPSTSITTQATNQTACFGEVNDNFTIVAGGHPPVTYEWQYSVDGTNGWATVVDGTPANANYTNETTAALSVADGSVETSIAAGTYYYRVVVGSGCGDDVISEVRTLTVNALPIATLESNDGDNSICQGTQVVFTAGGGTNYNFYLNNESVQNGAGTTYTTSSLTDGAEVYVVVTDVNSCSATSETITTDVEGTPVNPTLATATPNSGTTVCQGSTVEATFTAGNGGTGDEFRYSLDNGNSWEVDAYVAGTDLTAGTETIIIQGRRVAEVCADGTWETLATWNVELTPVAPDLVKVPEGASVCDGDDVSANWATMGTGGNGNVSIQYRTNDGNGFGDWETYTGFLGEGGYFGFDISTTGLTDVEIKFTRNGTACTPDAVNTVSWNVNPLPVADASIVGATTVCEGTVVTFTTPEVVGATYAWVLPNEDPSTDREPTFDTDSYSGENTAILTVTSADGCESESEVTFTVDPAIVVQTVNEASYCSGTTATLLLLDTENGVDYEVLLGDNPLGTPIIQNGTGNAMNINVPNAAAGTYTVRASRGTCTNVAMTGSVVVNPSPTADAGDDDATCVSTPYTVSDASSTDNVGVAWTEDGAGTITAGANSLTPTYTPAPGDAGNTVTLTLTATALGGCTNAIDTKELTVDPTSVGGTATATLSNVCNGTGTTITLVDYTGSIQWQYLNSSEWVNIDGQNGAILNTGNLTSTMMYRAVVSSGSCASANSTEAQVSVYDAFSAGTIVAGDETICYEGNPAEITASAPTGGDATYIYKWQSTTATIPQEIDWSDINLATSASYDPPTGLTTTTKYRRLVQDETCQISYVASSGVRTVTVTPLPTITASGATPSSLCGSGTATFSATASAGSVVWFTAAVDGSVVNDVTDVNITETTTYYAEAQNGSCISTARTAVTVTVNTVPAAPTAGNVTVTYDGAVHTGTATPPDGATVVWYTSIDGNTTTSAPSRTNVGTSTAWAESVLGSCVSATRTQLTVTVNGKLLTISGISIDNKVYDGGTDATISGTATLVGVELGDDVTLGGTPSAVFTGEDVANDIPVTVSGYTISGSGAGNYTLTQPSGLTANITAKELTITGISINDKSYTGTNNAVISGTAALNGVINPDEVTLNTGLAVATFNDVNAGTNKATTVSGYTISGTDAGNYTLTQPSGLLANITKAPLTITAENKEKCEGTVNPALTMSYATFVNSENSSVLDVLPTIATTAVQGSPDGDYPITLTGGSDNNYEFTLQNGTLTINPLPDAAGAISGPTSVSPGQTGVAYSIAAVNNATGYTWVYSGTNASIASGSNTNSITVDYAANATSGTWTVTPYNTCGNGTAADLAITVSALPSVLSINRADGQNALTNSSTLNYTVTFSEAVTGVTAANFSPATTGTFANEGTVGVTGSGTTWTVTLTGVAGNGTIKVNLDDISNIEDNENNGLSGTRNGDQLVTVDQILPVVNITAPVANAYINGTQTLVFGITDANAGASSTAKIAAGTLTTFLSGSATSTLAGWGAAADGSHFITVSHTDLAGNTGTATVTINKDTDAPAIAAALAADPTGTPTTVTVTFDEPVDETSAETPGNYALSGTFGWNVNASAAVMTGNTVALTVPTYAGITTGQTLIVTVSNVTDVAGNAIAGPNNVATYTKQLDPPSKLVFLPISNQVSGTSFDVTVQSQTADGTPSNVTQNTPLTITIAAGGGALTVSGTPQINVNTNQTTVTLTYTKVDGAVNAQLNVDNNGGMALDANNSNQFNLLVQPPSTQAFGITTAPTKNSASISFDKGNGEKRLIVIEKTDILTNIDDPTNGTEYTLANSVYTSAPVVADNTRAVYAGTATNLTVTNLTRLKWWSVKVYEYNGTGATTSYNITDAVNNPTKFYTPFNKEIGENIFVGLNNTLEISNIYPQPAKDNFKIDYFASENMNITLNIFDMKGSVVANVYKGHTLVEGEGVLDINLDNYQLSSGTYTLSIESNDSAIIIPVTIIK